MQVQSIQHSNSISKKKGHLSASIAQNFGASMPPSQEEKISKVIKDCGTEIYVSLKKGLKSTAKILSEKLAKLAEEVPKK